MSLLADSIVDWGALLQVAYISAIAGIVIATVLGLGVVSSLRAQDHKGGAAALAYNAITVVCVLVVAAAIVIGIVFMINKS